MWLWLKRPKATEATGLRLSHTTEVSQRYAGQQKNLMFLPDYFTSLLVSGFEP